jgi:hypothetical protein
MQCGKKRFLLSALSGFLKIGVSTSTHNNLALRVRR